MGLSDSKPVRLTTEERQHREQTKATMVKQRQEEISRVQQDMIESVRSNPSTAIISAKDVVAMIKVTETAKTQLDRGGNVLTKADLIAVIIALQPSLRSNIAHLESVTVSDLNSMIRNIIYDPSRVMGSTAAKETAFVKNEAPKNNLLGFFQ
jgi:hypothetical protein